MSRTFSCFLFAITLVLIANNFGRPTPSLAPRPSLDAAVLLRARRKAASSPMSTSQQQQLAMHVQPLSFPPPAPSAAIGGAPFSPGQSDQAKISVKKAIDKQIQVQLQAEKEVGDTALAAAHRQIQEKLDEVAPPPSPTNPHPSPTWRWLLRMQRQPL